MKGIHECSARPRPALHTSRHHSSGITKALRGANLTPLGRKLEFTRDTQFQNQLEILLEWTTLVSVDSAPLFGVVIPAALCCLHEDGWRVHTGQS